MHALNQYLHDKCLFHASYTDIFEEKCSEVFFLNSLSLSGVLTSFASIYAPFCSVVIPPFVASIYNTVLNFVPEGISCPLVFHLVNAFIPVLSWPPLSIPFYFMLFYLNTSVFIFAFSVWVYRPTSFFLRELICAHSFNYNLTEDNSNIFIVIHLSIHPSNSVFCTWNVQSTILGVLKDTERNET